MIAQGSALATSALADARESALAQRLPSEGTPPRALMRFGTGLPRLEWVDPQNSGVASFVLDDPVEERELVSYNGVLGGMARLMHIVLVSMNDGLVQLNSASGPFQV